MNTRAVGSRKEAQAAVYLQKKGYEIQERNYRCKLGEIDIIAKDGAQLVFVEVKYRASAQWGPPTDAVGYKKQVRISNVASYYLHTHYFGQEIPCRFDVVSICGEQVQHFLDAFSYCGRCR